MIPPGVGVFHSDQLEVVVSADLVLLPVTFFDNLIRVVLFTIQLDREHRIFLLSCALIDHKIKATGVEKTLIGDVVREDLRDGNLLVEVL